MEAEDLLDKFAQDEGFGNWDTVVLNCHHSVIRSVAIAAVNEALRQPLVSGELNCEHDWLVDMYDHFGFPASKFCDKCNTREAI